MLIKRLVLPRIEKKLFQGKAIIIYGPRRVGKTTLVKEIEKKYLKQTVYLNCDEPDVRTALINKTSTELFQYIGNKKIVIIDEGQRIKNIGLTIKLLVDNYPQIQIIATGSSSFDLSNKIKEPLTGRAYEFFLAPLSILEMNQSKIEIKRLIENFLIFGLYPETINKNNEEKKEILRAIYKNYLYKDIFEYQYLKNHYLIENLLSALALQIGSEVSYTELANLLKVDQKTVAFYIRILELAFVIFRLPPLSKNLRSEISKSRKIYFWDLGIRNAIINNFNPLSLRQDIEGLWENFVVAEKIKKNLITGKDPNYYFWRTWKKQEIDFVEEYEGKFYAYEIKWKKQAKKIPKLWKENYQNSSFEIINAENFLEILKKY